MLTDVAKILVNSDGKFMAKKLKVCSITEQEDVVPPKSIRIRFSNETLDASTIIANNGIWTKVIDSEYNDWDFTIFESILKPESFINVLTYELDPSIKIVSCGNLSGIDLTNMFKGCTGITRIIDFDFAGISTITSMFENCVRLAYVPDSFNFRTIRYLDNAFKNCKYLSKIPNIEFNKLTLTVENTFNGCERVETGMIEFYNTYSIIAKNNKKFKYNNCFTKCGILTESGIEDRKFIPILWGGDLD